MEKVKKKRIGMKFSVLILTMILFMGVGYAKVNDTFLTIEGLSEVELPKKVLITEASYLSSENNADLINSNINHITGTFFDSKVVLGNDINSLITYQLKIYNNTDYEQMFIDAITDTTDPDIYSNSNITFTYTKLEKYKTTLAPGEWIVIQLTFSYLGNDTSNNTLMSKINFRFKEIPVLTLSNEGETYNVENMYPGYTKEYNFSISNFLDDKISNVPMNYSFNTIVDSPFIVKIYDESGIEVVQGNIDGDLENKISNNYTLKITWDNSLGENVNYEDYLDKTYNGKVVLNANPVDTQTYLDYQITKEFNVNVETSKFYFETEGDTDLDMETSGAVMSLKVKNFSGSNYNVFDTFYEISIEGNQKFSFSVDGTTAQNNKISKALLGGSSLTDTLDINFLADINDLEKEENLNLKIVTKSPYYKETIIPVTISLQPVTVTLDFNNLEGTTQTITVYKGKKYNNLPTPTLDNYEFKGWYTSLVGGSKYDSNTIVSVNGSEITLYAKWLALPVAINNVQTIDMTQEEASKYYGQVVKTVNGTSFNPNPNDSRTWRVFYIDTENKYGDGKGTIYLKADDISSKTMRFSTTNEASDASGYDSEFTTLSNTRYYKISGSNVVNSSGTVINTLYLKLNPTYATGRKNISSTLFYENEKAAAYLSDQTQFTTYTDDRTNYAIGSPSVEMWIDSWNSVYGNDFMFYYRYNTSVDGTTGAQKLPGYQFKLNSGDWGQAGGTEEIDINTIDTIGMYKTSNGMWFSSPAIVYLGGSLVRLSSSGFIGNATINTYFAYSPVVSLNSETFVYTTEYVE